LETVVKRLYEAMFLVDSAQAAADWEGTLSVIKNILQRADAEIVSLRKWQERKLAYDIDRKSRGTYILCYFNADGRRIGGIEKDVQLSEKVMRVLVLTTEKRPAEMIERDITGLPEEKASEPSSDADETKVRPEEPSADADEESDSGDDSGDDADEESDSGDDSNDEAGDDDNSGDDKVEGEEPVA
jgi:small subunit ribosomal protein S6